MEKRMRKLTLSSMICHFSPTRSARSDHISFRTAMYAVASVSNLTPSHCSALRRSINRSCLLRQAFAVLLGKCLEAMGCQFRPEALAVMRISSSSAVHIEVTRVPLASDGRAAGVVLYALLLLDLYSLGMVYVEYEKGEYEGESGRSKASCALREWV
jgi:hypothetical protein